MCRRVQGSQIFKQNWIILIRSRVIVILPIWLSSALGGGGCLGWSAIVYMSSGIFRGKESSNRIELSPLVQDLLNFAVLAPCGSGGGGGWMGVGGDWGCPPHMCTCTCTHAHIHVKHDNFNCKWQPPLGESLGIPYDVICVRAYMHMHVYVCGGTPNHPHPHPPTPHPPGGTPRISQNSIALELIKIFQFRLKIWNLWRLSHPWVGVWFGGWVDGLMGRSGQNTKNLKIVDWIKIIQFCLKIYDL